MTNLDQEEIEESEICENCQSRLIGCCTFCGEDGCGSSWCGDSLITENEGVTHYHEHCKED